MRVDQEEGMKYVQLVVKGVSVLGRNIGAAFLLGCGDHHVRQRGLPGDRRDYSGDL